MEHVPAGSGLRVKERLVPVDFSDEPAAFQPLEVLVNQLSITGSLIGSRATIRAILTFGLKRGILPMVELLLIMQSNEAIQRLRTRGARYRIVMANTSGRDLKLIRPTSLSRTP